MHSKILVATTALLTTITAQAAQPAWPDKPVRLVLGSAVQEAPLGLEKLPLPATTSKQRCCSVDHRPYRRICANGLRLFLMSAARVRM